MSWILAGIHDIFVRGGLCGQPVTSDKAGSVRLRDVIDDDLAILFEHQADPEASRMAAFPSRDRESFLAHWAKIRVDPTTKLQTILLDGQVAGSILSFERLGKREVGYWIDRAFWGRGIATRALAAFLRYDTARPLYALVVKTNLASIRVLEKCGFAIIGECGWPPEDPVGDLGDWLFELTG